MTEKASPDQGWHIKKEITLGHLITTASMVVTALWWASSVETRLAVMSEREAMLAEANNRQDEAIKATLETINQRLQRIEDKLDTKVDR